MLSERTLTIASKYKTFHRFRAAHPDIYVFLLKRPDSLKRLHAMFEDGSIHTYKPASARRKDGSLYRPDGSKPEKLPNIKRDEVRKFAKYYRTHSSFRGNAGKYAVAAKRLDMYDELEEFFSRRLTVPEIREEAAHFPDWDSFAIDRPKYAHDAEKHGIRDAIEHLMNQKRSTK